jgi:two-component system sensor histidine kinase PilS (NtrC family)
MADRKTTLNRPAQPPTNLQNLTLFRIYVFYRSLLSLLLLLALLSADTRQLVGILNPTLYLYVACVFLATNLVLLALLRSHLLQSQVSLFAVFFVDILAITLLADTSGGMSSGLPILLVVTAAASAILITSSTIATLIAALSVIAVLADTIRLINEQVLSINNLLPAGVLGMLIFTVSLLIQMVARRVGMAEDLARKRAADLYNLQRLNEQIVQNLQTGILMVYADGKVRVMNQAATRLLGPERHEPLEQGHPLTEYNRDLAEQFHLWTENDTHTPTPLMVKEDAPQVIASFRSLDSTRPDGDALVFIEDYSPITQKAQSLKLASLGRLTASIAHEIRNPLGAVSHAAQLLGESSQLPVEDQRLTDIIEHHTRRMNAIIENVMHISRRQAPRPQPLALRGWLQNFLGGYRAAITHESEIDVRLPDESVEILFDPEHLHRVLSNLLDNALRHSRSATGRPTAQIGVTWEHLSRRCLIEIVDDGLGVAESEQAKLFEPFYTTVEGGTGLGLYLCKELCEINHATLVYRRTAQGKSCFRIAIQQRG